ncbi:MAG TPA: hypothetical protein VLM40_23435 [Gemmata sp.]|nr:hypothetical protein [Gemmata sp.]
MHAPAVALAWEFWWRHRWGLAGIGGLVAGFAAICAASPFDQNTAMVHSIWFAIGLLYAISVFSYGFETRLEAPESGFPVRHFILPVRTSVLVSWPMVQGMVVAVALWLAWDRLVLRPSGIETPAWWPAMLAALVACGQALLWLPFGLPWLRLLVGGVVVSALVRTSAIYDAIAPSLGIPAEWVSNPEQRNIVLGGFAAALIPIAFLVAWAGVGWARRGDTPDWLRTWRPLWPSAKPLRERPPFASALRAQVWYESRLRGRGFVVTVVIFVVLLMVLALALWTPQARADFGLAFLFIPLLIASFWGSQMGSPGESIRTSALSTFAATRPMNDAAMVAAKFWAATRTAIAAWLTVLLLTAVWFAFTDGFERMQLTWEGAVAKYGAAQALGGVVLWAVVLVLGTLRALVVNLWIGLAGRAWLVPTHMMVNAVVGFQFLLGLGYLNATAARREMLSEGLPLIIGGAILLKFALAARFVQASRRRAGLELGTAARLVAIWFLIAGGLFGMLACLVPEDQVPLHELALGVVLFVPLTRFLAAPLALAWNRHR